MVRKPIILSMDGFCNPGGLLAEAVKILHEKHGENGNIGLIKINDAAHMQSISGPEMMNALLNLKKGVGVFLDLKLGDVGETLKNIASHYRLPNILTVSAIIDAEGFVSLRTALPLPETKLALFSVPTDMSEEKCRKRYEKNPAEKIIHDVRCLEEDYQEIKKPSFMPQLPFDLIVCSPRELEALTSAGLNKKYGFICPGIRDEWMNKGQQERTTGVAEALEKGASYVVLGSQMLKGNPEEGISARESRRKTMEEIDGVRAEGGGHA